MKKLFKFELGQAVKDKYTDFDGVIMARTQYITGCTQYSVLNPKLDKDGDIRGWLDFDEARLKIVKKKFPIVAKTSRRGGPMPKSRSTNR